jgi:tetratricopeptide (TPR) repeat protein
MLRGQVDLYRGHGQESIEHLEESVRLMPESIAAKAMLGQAYRQDGRIERYYALINEIIDAAPANTEDRLFSGWAVSADNLPLAADMLDEAVSQRDSALARLLRSEVRMMRAMYSGRPEHAELALEDATVVSSLLPDNVAALTMNLYAHLVAANVFRETGQQERGQNSLKQARLIAEALAAFPGHPAAHRARVSYFQQIGDRDSALKEASRIGRTLAVGAQLYGRGEYAEAVDAFDQLIKGGSDFALETARAFALAELPGGPERALESARELMGCWNPSLPAMVFLLLGQKADLVEACPGLQSNETSKTEWRGSLVGYLCGDVQESDFLSTADQFHMKVEAHTLIALEHLANGDRVAATESFRKSVQTNAFLDFYWAWSFLFLARLEEDPGWPPWIPQRRPVAAEPLAVN